MKKSALIVIAVLIAAILITLQAFTREKGPHGGTVMPAGEFYAEAGYSGDEIFAYLLDSTMNAVPNEDITCIAEFSFTDGTIGNLDLVPDGKTKFHAKRFETAYTSCTLTFLSKGRKVSAEFDNSDILITTQP